MPRKAGQRTCGFGVTWWEELDRLGDDELVDALFCAVLAEQAERRDRIFEVLRERHKGIPVQVFRQAGAPEALEEDFLSYFWSLDRLASSLASYRRSARRERFANHLFVKARWVLCDYFRSRKRRSEPKPLPDDLPAPRAENCDPPARSEGDLARVRDCVERLRATLRVPFKLVHVAALDFGEADWAHLVAVARRPRAELEAAMETLRCAGRSLTLAEVASLMNIKLHTAGTYVARAQRAIRDCLRQKAVQEGRA
jgi:DNA-directed RNA polymerase specialized sigma24 family protein